MAPDLRTRYIVLFVLLREAWCLKTPTLTMRCYLKVAAMDMMKRVHVISLTFP